MLRFVLGLTLVLFSARPSPTVQAQTPSPTPAVEEAQGREDDTPISTEEKVGAGVIGGVVGVIAAAMFGAFMRDLARDRFHKTALSGALGLLLGSTLAAAPLGQWVIDESLWMWFAFGEAIVFLPLALYAIGPWYRRVVRDIR